MEQLKFLREIFRFKAVSLIAFMLVPLLAQAAHIIPSDTVIQGMLDVGNLNLTTNTLSSSNANGDIILNPNGTGGVLFNDLTATTVPYLDANKELTSSAVTPTELGFVGGVTSSLCGINQSCTLTNKTIDGDTNTVQDLTPATFKTDVANAGKVFIFATTTGIPSASATLPNAVQDNITRLGTVTSGTWNAGVIPLLYGGTGVGAASANAAFNALSPMTTAGDIIYGGVAGAGTRLGIGSTNQVLTVTAGIPSWANSAAGYNSSETITNLGFNVSVAANAWTVALKQADGTTDPAAGSGAVLVGIRNGPTNNDSGYSVLSITGALSMTVSSGSTLGQVSGVAIEPIYIYIINNAGTAELAVSTKHFNTGEIVSTTAEGGAGAADSRTTMYSTTARSTVGFRLIARVKAGQTTAGTWLSASSSRYLHPMRKQMAAGTVCSAEITQSTGAVTNEICSEGTADWISSCANTSAGDSDCTYIAGIWGTNRPSCTLNPINCFGAVVGTCQYLSDATNTVDGNSIHCENAGATETNCVFVHMCQKVAD